MASTNPMVLKFEKNQQEIAKLNRKIEAAVGELTEKKQSLEAANAEMREAILTAMEDNDVDKFDGDLITITRVKATVRRTFDAKKFAEENPKRAEKYMRDTKVKASIRIKVKA